MAGYNITTQPATEPVSLAEAKDFLRIEDRVDERIINMMIKSAREWAENYTGRSFINRTVTLYLDWVRDLEENLLEGWYDGADIPRKRRYIPMPIGPVHSVTSFKTYDDNDVGTVFSPDNYYVNTSDPIGKINLRDGASWITNLRKQNGIEIIYVAGYGTNQSDVPESIRLAMLQYMAFNYENRGDYSGNAMPPSSIESLLRPHRILNFSSNPFGG
jgi:hypothetical protein